MAQKIKVAGDNLTLDLLLVRRHGLKGQRLVAETLAINPGLADQGPILPVGLEITLPDLPVDVAEPVKVVTLFGMV